MRATGSLVLLALALSGLNLGCAASGNYLSGAAAARRYASLPAGPAQQPAQPGQAVFSTDLTADTDPKAPPQDLEAGLPVPRRLDAPAVLELAEVLESVDRAFPLLLAAEQERVIASGRRLSAEGGFDLNLRSRSVQQDGTFPSNRLDLIAEQPTPWYGTSFYGGYRFGFGDFPVYYGDRLTADGGEFRAGVAVPLLRDGPIDRRRALLRQAQLGEPLADAVVQRLRIDYARAAAYRYWNWVAAGEQYGIANRLLGIARERQAALEDQFKKGAIAEFVVIDNRRLIAEREGLRIASERRVQQASLELSLYLRDAEGNPLVPTVERLPRTFFQQEPPPPDCGRLQEDVQTALNLRPELTRFRLLQEQVAVDLRLAENQTFPALNLAVGGAQDVGQGKKSEGIFALDRTVAEAALLLEVPLQRRDARGKAQAAQAAMMQLLAQERFGRDQIVVDVQDAVSNLDRTHARLQQARQEQRIAQRVAELELERFRGGQSTLLEVNLRELAAAGARSKVIDALADFYRAQADHRAALGLDAVPADQSALPR